MLLLGCCLLCASGRPLLLQGAPAAPLAHAQGGLQAFQCTNLSNVVQGANVVQVT
jgi:hypothetical protein